MTQHRILRPLLAGLFATVLVVGAAGCGDDDEPTETGAGDDGTGGTAGGDDYGGTTGGGGEASAGTIVAVDYELSDITVGPGDPIVLRNDGEEAHTSKSDDDLFDLGEVEPGDTSEPDAAPTEPGEYTFHCEIHDTMTATLTVEE